MKGTLHIIYHVRYCKRGPWCIIFLIYFNEDIKDEYFSIVYRWSKLWKIWNSFQGVTNLFCEN